MQLCEIYFIHKTMVAVRVERERERKRMRERMKFHPKQADENSDPL